MEPMEIEPREYKDASEGTLLSWIVSHGSEKPLNSSVENGKVSPVLCECTCGYCCTKAQSNNMETEDEENEVHVNGSTSGKNTQTTLTYCPRLDIYSCPIVTKEDVHAFKLLYLLEKLSLDNKARQASNCKMVLSHSVYDAKTVHLICEMCSAQSVPMLVQHKCDVMSFCYDVLDDKSEHNRDLLMACVGLLDAVILHDKDVCNIVANTRQTIHLKLCLLFDILVEDKEKQLLVSLFKKVVKQALTIDDEVFQRMVFRVCSILNAPNESLLLEIVLFLDAAVELYQEWDIHIILLNYGIYPAIVSFVSHSNFEIKVKSLRILGNLLSLEALNINWAVIHAGVLNQLFLLLLSEDPELVKQSLWVLSNVTAGPKGSTKILFHYGIIPTILKHLQSGCGHVANEALYVIANLIEDSSPKQRTVLMKDKQVLAAMVLCLQADKSELEPTDVYGGSYLELLRDTFKTIHNCLKPKEENEESPKYPSDTDSEYDESEDAEENEEQSERTKGHFLQEEDKKELLRFLQEEHGLCKHLKAVCERDYKDTETGLKNDIEEIHQNFRTLLGMEES